MESSVRISICILMLGAFAAGCSESRNGVVAVRQSPSWTSPSPAPSQSTQSDSEVLFGYVNPNADPRYNITMSEIREHLNNNSAVFIDARGPASYALGHVRGALNVPAGNPEDYLPQIRERVAPDQLIIIYCNSLHCESSDKVYEFLMTQGYNNMRVFKPGWQELTKQSDLK